MKDTLFKHFSTWLWRNTVESVVSCEPALVGQLRTAVGMRARATCTYGLHVLSSDLKKCVLISFTLSQLVFLFLSLDHVLTPLCLPFRRGCTQSSHDGPLSAPLQITTARAFASRRRCLSFASLSTSTTPFRSPRQMPNVSSSFSPALLPTNALPRPPQRTLAPLLLRATPTQ